MTDLQKLTRRVRAIESQCDLERLFFVSRDLVVASNSSNAARIGDLYSLDGGEIAIVTWVAPNRIGLIPGNTHARLSSRSKAARLRNGVVPEVDALLRRVLDPFLRPLDDKGPVPHAREDETVAVVPRPAKQLDSAFVCTGVADVDCLMPLQFGRTAMLVSQMDGLADRVIDNMRADTQFDVAVHVSTRAPWLSDAIATDCDGSVPSVNIVAGTTNSSAARDHAYRSAAEVATRFAHEGKHVLLTLECPHGSIFSDVDPRVTAAITKGGPAALRRQNTATGTVTTIWTAHSHGVDRSKQTAPSLDAPIDTFLHLREGSDAAAEIRLDLISSVSSQQRNAGSVVPPHIEAARRILTAPAEGSVDAHHQEPQDAQTITIRDTIQDLLRRTDLTQPEQWHNALGEAMGACGDRTVTPDAEEVPPRPAEGP